VPVINPLRTDTEGPTEYVGCEVITKVGHLPEPVGAGHPASEQVPGYQRLAELSTARHVGQY
jgi:hypothetical protein